MAMNLWPVTCDTRQIDKIEKIQWDSEENGLDFKISNWATWITCFTCFTLHLLTASFLCIFYEIKNLKNNVVKVRIRKS